MKFFHLFVALLLNFILSTTEFRVVKPHHLEGNYQFTTASKTNLNSTTPVFGSPYLASNCEIYPLSIAKPEFGCQHIHNNVKDTIVMARRGV
jgi:hypothetical protein